MWGQNQQVLITGPVGRGAIKDKKFCSKYGDIDYNNHQKILEPIFKNVGVNNQNLITKVRLNKSFVNQQQKMISQVKFMPNIYNDNKSFLTIKQQIQHQMKSFGVKQPLTNEKFIDLINRMAFFNQKAVIASSNKFGHYYHPVFSKNTYILSTNVIANDIREATMKTNPIVNDIYKSSPPSMFESKGKQIKQMQNFRIGFPHKK